MAAHFVGIDVGGTTCTLAIGNAQRQVLHVSEQFPTQSSAGPLTTIASIGEQLHESLKRTGVDARDVAGVGLCTPGPASFDGTLQKAPNFDPALWSGFPFRRRLEEGLRRHIPGVAVHYLGDGQAAALGEYVIRGRDWTWDRVAVGDGDLEPNSSIFVVIVGTGLGGGAVVHGRVVRGANGRAGHVGHVLLPASAFRHPQDQLLKVGNAFSSAESAVSLTGLTHQLGFRLTLPEWRNHPLNRTTASMREKAKLLRELADGGDPLAQQLFEDQARALGIALLNANYLGDYDQMVIGGGVCDLGPRSRERYLRIVTETYEQFALDGFVCKGGIVFAVCGDDAPVIGALAYGFRNSERRGASPVV